VMTESVLAVAEIEGQVTAAAPWRGLAARSEKAPRKDAKALQSGGEDSNLQGKKKEYYYQPYYYGDSKYYKGYRQELPYPWFGGYGVPYGYGGYYGGYPLGGYPLNQGNFGGINNINQGNVAGAFSNPSNWVAAPGSQQVMIPRTDFNQGNNVWPIRFSGDQQTGLPASSAIEDSLLPPSVDASDHMVGALRSVLKEVLSQFTEVSDKTVATNVNYIQTGGGAGLFDRFREITSHPGPIASIINRMFGSLQEANGGDQQLVLETLEKLMEESMKKSALELQ